VSPRTLTRRGRLSWPTPRECENSAGAIRRIRLVWKPTTLSYRSILAGTSFLAEWWPRFVLFYGASPAPCLPRQAGSLACLRDADLTRSTVLRLPKSSRQATTGRFACKLFSLRQLPSGVRRRGLTRGDPERYTAIHRGRSRRGGLSKSPNGPVGGLSPEIVESAV